jgi:hypothetical protein
MVTLYLTLETQDGLLGTICAFNFSAYSAMRLANLDECAHMQ